MKVLVFPKDHNPYQELLYTPMREQYHDLQVTYCKRYSYIGVLSFPLVAVWRRLEGYRICHIHWPAFTISKPVPFHKQLSKFLFRFCIKLLSILGYQIVWTAHNVLPHEPQTTDDLGDARLLSKKAAAIIAHSKFTITEMSEHGLDTNHTHVIPHGNYLTIYPNTISRDAARRLLGIKKDEQVVLFFGKVRKYKGIDDLLEAWRKVESPKYRLIIAGYCDDAGLLKTIHDAVEDSKQIDFYNQHVADPDVATYFNAADVVCLPFKSITTSGSALWALGFGKPLIAPKSGALLDLPAGVGYLYNPTKGRALEEQLKSALRNPKGLLDKGDRALDYAKTLSWKSIAARTYELYEDVLGLQIADKS